LSSAPQAGLRGLPFRRAFCAEHHHCGSAKILIVIDLKERSRKRRETIETHRARSIADAEAWDLEYWQRRTPEERLSALVAIHRDVALVEAARSETSGPDR